MQTVMLVLVESIKRTLWTGSLRIKSVLLSEVAQVWIITSPAFASDTHGGKDVQHVPPLPPLLSLWGLEGSLQFFLLSSPVFMFNFLAPPTTTTTTILFILPAFSLLSVSPRAFRSAAQLLLNNSQPTTLCIFCAVPLHPSIQNHSCLTWLVFACLSVCAPCNCASTTSCAPTSVCVCEYLFCCFCIYFKVLHLCHWMVRSARPSFFTSRTHTHVRVSHRQTCPQFKTVHLFMWWLTSFSSSEESLCCGWIRGHLGAANSPW